MAGARTLRRTPARLEQEVAGRAELQAAITVALQTRERVRKKMVDCSCGPGRGLKKKKKNKRETG